MSTPTSSLFELTDRVALITGGAGLLGREYAEALASAGAHVVLADLHGEAAKAVAEQLTQKGFPRALGIQADVAEKESVQRMIQQVMECFGRLDILINNAALTVKGGTSDAEEYFAPVEEYPLSLWENALAVNLTGTFLCCQEAAKPMLAQGRGVIVNISSTYGVVGPDKRIYSRSRNPHDPSKKLNTPPSYSATKGAILSLTRYLAAYWAGKGIRVNALTPGGVYDGHDEEFVKSYSSRAILGRMADRNEYQGAILFLSSDASSYMTGANLIVDGGWTAW